MGVAVSRCLSVTPVTSPGLLQRLSATFCDARLIGPLYCHTLKHFTTAFCAVLVVMATHSMWGRNRTDPPCNVGRPTAHAPGGRPANRQHYTRRRWQTPASKIILFYIIILGGPVTIQHLLQACLKVDNDNNTSSSHLCTKFSQPFNLHICITSSSLVTLDRPLTSSSFNNYTSHLLICFTLWLPDFLRQPHVILSTFDSPQHQLSNPIFLSIHHAFSSSISATPQIPHRFTNLSHQTRTRTESVLMDR